jgi:hypothetical protein
MSVTREILNSLGSTISIVRSGPTEVRAGAAITVGLAPAASELSVTDVVTGALELLWITKDVIFKDASLEHTLDETTLTSDGTNPPNPAHRIMRGLPIPDAVQALNGAVNGTLTGLANGTLNGTVSGALTGGTLTGPVTGTVSGPLTGALTGTITGQAGQAIGTAANAPGLLGQLQGSIPIAPVQVPVGLQVTWSVLNSDASPPTALVEGTDFVAPSGLRSPIATFILMPNIVRMTTSIPAPARRTIRATVVLSVGTVSSDPIQIDLPILVPSVGIPTMLALFRHPNFAPSANAGKEPGVVLIVVPPDSPLASFSQILTVLGALSTAVEPLAALPVTPAVNFSSFLLGLGSLTSALSAPQPIVLIEARTSIPLLDPIRIDRGIFTIPIFDVDVLPLNAEDRFDSLIFIGKSGDGASLFNNRSFDTTGGAITVTTMSEMFVIVRDLRSATPVSEPMGDLTVDTAPDNGLSPRSRDPFDWGHRVSTFAHEFSSLRLNLP